MRLALTAALLLAACGQKAEEAPKTEAAAPAPPSLAKASRALAYVCEKDMPVTAIYGTNAEGKADVALIVKGMDLRLDETVAASGARYTSAQGLEAGMGIIWWTKGDEALLQQVPVANIADAAAAQTIRTCQLKGDKPPPGSG